jgi:hypothetical protein
MRRRKQSASVNFGANWRKCVMAKPTLPLWDDFLNLADNCREEGKIALKILGYEIKALQHGTRVMIIVLEDHNHCDIFLPNEEVMDEARNQVISRLIHQLHVRSGYALPHHKMLEEAFLCHVLDELISRRISLVFERIAREHPEHGFYTVMRIV